MAKYALRMLGTEKNVSDLKPGDILLGFHSEPYAVIAGLPEDGKTLYPDNKYAHDNWYIRTRVADPLGLREETEGTNVFTKGTTVRVGTVPLRQVKGRMFTWEKPDGTTVELH